VSLTAPFEALSGAFPDESKCSDGRGWLPLHWAVILAPAADVPPAGAMDDFDDDRDVKAMPYAVTLQDVSDDIACARIYTCPYCPTPPHTHACTPLLRAPLTSFRALFFRGR